MGPQPCGHAWFNGKVVDLSDAAPSVASNSLHLGTSVFEGLMAYWNEDHYYFHRMSEHLKRFETGCNYMDLEFPWSVQDLERGMSDLLANCDPTTHYIRPICFRGAPSVPAVSWKGIDVPVDVCIVATPVARDIDSPFSCKMSPYEQISSRAMPIMVKASGVYVNSFLCQKDADETGFDTGIMLDRSGRISEASTCNIFFIQGERLVTPSLDADVFPGITRKMILEIAINRGIDVVQRDVFEEELPAFDGSFLCATLMEVRAISNIDGQMYPTQSNTLFCSILRDFRTITWQ